jgi:cobalamin biosynthesis protein CobD/CbiB
MDNVKEKFKAWLAAMMGILALLTNFIVMASNLLKSRFWGLVVVGVLIGTSYLVHLLLEPFYFYVWIGVVMILYFIGLMWLNTSRGTSDDLAQDPSNPHKKS